MRPQQYRRHTFVKAKKKAVAIVKIFIDIARNPKQQKLIGKHVHTRHPCSCEMCGNQRKYYGAPISEKRDASNYIEYE